MNTAKLHSTLSKSLLLKRLLEGLATIVCLGFMTLISFTSVKAQGVLSFIDLDPTPPELFEACIENVLDIEGILECTTNVEVVNTKEFQDCNGNAVCERYAYSVPLFPEKLALHLEDTYDDLWERNIKDIKDYAYDAWRDKACAISAYPGVLADVNLHGHGDASLKYWSEVFVTSSYYLPASLWGQTPFPGVGDFSDDKSDRIVTPIFSLIPKPEQYVDLFEQTTDGIYYFQPPAFPDYPIMYDPAEVVEGHPGLYEKELLKKALRPASALEHSQFGYASFFEVYGKRRIIDVIVVWVKECVPTPKTSPVGIFPIPVLPRAETRQTSSPEGYEISEIGEQSWFPDPISAYELNSVQVAAERMLENPLYAPGVRDALTLDTSNVSPLDPKYRLLQDFIYTRIPLAKDRGIPQEVVEDAQKGAKGKEPGAGTNIDIGGGIGGLLEEDEALGEILNCLPTIVGPNGSQPYPILAVDADGVTRTGHYNEAIQYLFKESENLFSPETQQMIESFRSSYGLPDTSYPGTWRTSSSSSGFIQRSSGVLCEGDSGSEVAALDRLLARAGYSEGGVSANEFDDVMEQNLIEFQSAMGLEPDGMTGPETWAALHAAAGNNADPPGYQPPVLGLPPGQTWPGGPPPPPSTPNLQDPSNPQNVSPPQPSEAATASEPEQGGEVAAPTPPPPDSRELAQEVLADSNIMLLDGAALEVNDGSDPYSNIQAAANALPSQRSSLSEVGTGETWLSPYMLEGLLEIAKFHRIEVIAIAGGVHPADSPHYQGSSFAISSINDVRIMDAKTELTYSNDAFAEIDGATLYTPQSINGEELSNLFEPSDNPDNAFGAASRSNALLQTMAICEFANATEVLSPLNSERHADNVQCSWPTSEGL